MELQWVDSQTLNSVEYLCNFFQNIKLNCNPKLLLLGNPMTSNCYVKSVLRPLMFPRRSLWRYWFVCVCVYVCVIVCVYNLCLFASVRVFVCVLMCLSDDV